MMKLYDDGNVRISVRAEADDGEIGNGLQGAAKAVTRYCFDRASPESRAVLRRMLERSNEGAIGKEVIAGMREATSPVRLVPPAEEAKSARRLRPRPGKRFT